MAELPDGYFNLKHRLVGATVLILVAVILLPRVLTGAGVEPDGPNENTRTAPQIQPQILTVTTPSGSDPVENSSRTRIEIIDQPVVTITDEESGGVERDNSRLTNGKRDQSVAIRLSSDPSVSEAIVTGFVVQLGIFQQPENTRKLIAELHRDGIDVKTEMTEVDGRQATRIWIGPFSTRSQATREGNKAMMRTQSKPIIKEWP